ncbi:hypothetical protein NQ314_010351 [Rhamnusium bicolor]|uniref:HMG box domain-containing protein n=1 Tax=Rhamnusium bicolor TaxID=1586634 RepID=A0AAV8XRA8_9CUCU|nr:hypothetical protein NQ314_010351 [Rhamnusium bicolor]
MIMSKSRRSRSRSVKKSHTVTHTFRSGRVTRNPFLNFMRDFRKSNNGLKLTELTKRGAELWRKMNDRQKSPYCQLARQAPKRRSRRRRRRRKRRRRHNYTEDTGGFSSSDEEKKHKRDDHGKHRMKECSDKIANSNDLDDID